MKDKDKLPLAILIDDTLRKKRKKANMPPGCIGCNWTTYKKERAARQALKAHKEDLKFSSVK